VALQIRPRSFAASDRDIYSSGLKINQGFADFKPHGDIWVRHLKAPQSLCKKVGGECWNHTNLKCRLCIALRFSERFSNYVERAANLP